MGTIVLPVVDKLYQNSKKSDVPKSSTALAGRPEAG